MSHARGLYRVTQGANVLVLVRSVHSPQAWYNGMALHSCQHQVGTVAKSHDTAAKEQRNRGIKISNTLPSKIIPE